MEKKLHTVWQDLSSTIDVIEEFSKDKKNISQSLKNLHRLSNAICLIF
jgi:hypothetical protein